MILEDKFAKVKEFYDKNGREIFISLSFILVAFISFGLGRLSVLQEEKQPIFIEQTASAEFPPIDKILVGSKNSDKYHYVWCSGAKKISEDNKIFFSSKEEAESSGYMPAANCEGL